MRTFLPFFLFILIFLPKDVNAQWENSTYRQDTIIARMGIGRMITVFFLASTARESARIITTETSFDSFGRSVKSVNDVCHMCVTIMKYDSATGLVAYNRSETQSEVVENYTAYDAKKRRISTENCISNNEECELHKFEYDDDNTERMFKIINRKHVKLDTAKNSTHFLGLYSLRKEEKELVQERFFSPEGQLEEIRYYRDGKFLHSSIYEYFEEGRKIRIWHFDGKTKRISNEKERNENGQIISSIRYFLTVTDPLLKQESIIQSYEYDANGLLIKSTAGSKVAEYSYFTD